MTPAAGKAVREVVAVMTETTRRELTRQNGADAETTFRSLTNPRLNDGGRATCRTLARGLLSLVPACVIG